MLCFSFGAVQQFLPNAAQSGILTSIFGGEEGADAIFFLADIYAGKGF